MPVETFDLVFFPVLLAVIGALALATKMTSDMERRGFNGNRFFVLCVLLPPVAIVRWRRVRTDPRRGDAGRR
jgi:hypothetical protein